MKIEDFLHFCIMNDISFKVEEDFLSESVFLHCRKKDTKFSQCINALEWRTSTLYRKEIVKEFISYTEEKMGLPFVYNEEDNKTIEDYKIEILKLKGENNFLRMEMEANKRDCEDAKYRLNQMYGTMGFKEGDQNDCDSV